MPIDLIAPPNTAFDQTGALNLAVIERQARHLVANGVKGVFVGGSTGEGQSLTVAERCHLAERWVEVAKSFKLRSIVHVGASSQLDTIQLARHAATIGADTVACMAPYFFKPTSVDTMLDYLEPIAAEAGSLPFLFYDIPALTGVSISTVDLLRRGGERLPNLAGIKYTNSDLAQFQECVRLEDGRYEIWFGCDENLLAGYALGARGAVGSTYNFAARLYHRIVDAFDEGEFESARYLQAKAVGLVRVCQSFGFTSAAKSIMSLIGIDCGSVRAPLQELTPSQLAKLKLLLEELSVLDKKLVHPIDA